MNYRHTTSFKTVCGYDELQYVAQDHVDNGLMMDQQSIIHLSGKSLLDCQIFCNNKQDCKSILYCPNDKCYFSSAKITRDSLQIIPNQKPTNCFSSYQTCGKYFVYNFHHNNRVFFNFLTNSNLNQQQYFYLKQIVMKDVDVATHSQPKS